MRALYVYARPEVETMHCFTAAAKVLIAVYALLVALPFRASAQHQCGPQNDDQICPGNECCNSLSGWCGFTPDHCGSTCDAGYGKCGLQFAAPSNAPDIGQCGPTHGNCTGDLCCSVSNYCGRGKDYCAFGCQPAFGNCGLPTGDRLSTGAVIGIAAGCSVTFVAVVVAALSRWYYLKRKRAQPISYSKLNAATNGFDEAHKLGEGKYGEVYWGELDGKLVAVKKLKKLKFNSSKGSIANKRKAFEAEILTMNARLNHKNLMQVIGFCAKNEDRFLVYELMPNGSLVHWLFPSQHEHGEDNVRLEWRQRFNIVKGVAEGLIYLHHSLGGEIKSIVHGDVKPDNILLGQDLVPKLADFGMVQLIMSTKEGDESDTEAPSAAVPPGTYGYCAPETSSNFHGKSNLQNKADVWSFGIVLLEIVRGLRVYGTLEEADVNYYLPLLAVQYFLSEPEDLSIILDERLATDLGERERNEVRRTLRVALWCLQYAAKDRPSMNVVLDLLKGNTIDESKYQCLPDLDRMSNIFEDLKKDLFNEKKATYRCHFDQSNAISAGSHQSRSQAPPSSVPDSRMELQLTDRKSELNGRDDDEVQVGESSNSADSASLFSNSQQLSDVSGELIGQQRNSKGVNHPD